MSTIEKSTASKEASIGITGMTCAACATRIEKGLNKMEGVEQATVNLALEKSSIKYDSSKLSEEDFEKKIAALGYGVVKQKAEFKFEEQVNAYPFVILVK